jgi:hypothetical protein
MFLGRCKHRWEETRRYSRPPAEEFTFGSKRGLSGFLGASLWSDEAEDGLYGWTMIELQCERCGDVTTRKIRYTGDQAGGQ